VAAARSGPPRDPRSPQPGTDSPVTTPSSGVVSTTAPAHTTVFATDARMIAPAPMTAFGPTIAPAPITAPAPILTGSTIIAVGWIRAVGSTPDSLVGGCRSGAPPS